MLRKTIIRPTRDNIASCNSCDIKNYVSRFSPNEEITDVLYEVKIGITINTLCKNCLRDLVDKAEDILGTLS